jgi:NAD(P)H dehydrogenase (quinone)
VTSYSAVAAGELDVVADTVARVAGHEPMTLAELLEADPSTWAHLRANGGALRARVRTRPLPSCR